MNIGHDLVQRNAPAGAALLPASDRKRSKLARGAANSIVSRRARKRTRALQQSGAVFERAGQARSSSSSLLASFSRACRSPRCTSRRPAREVRGPAPDRAERALRRLPFNRRIVCSNGGLIGSGHLYHLRLGAHLNPREYYPSGSKAIQVAKIDAPGSRFPEAIWAMPVPRNLY